MTAVFIVAGVVAVLAWVRLVVMARRRARESAAYARDLRVRFEQVQRAQEAAEAKQQARLAQYKREMAARSMDRFRGRLKVAGDPTFEEWLADHGYQDVQEP